MVLPAAIAETDIQIAIVSKIEHAGIVVIQNLIDLEQDNLACSIGNIGIERRDLVFADMRFGSTLRGHIVDKKCSVLSIVGVKCQPKQAVLSKGRDTVGKFLRDIQKSLNLTRRDVRIVRENQNPSLLLNHKDPISLIRAKGEQHWFIKADIREGFPPTRIELGENCINTKSALE